MKRNAIIICFLLLSFAAHATTNVTSASLRLSDKSVLDLTAGLKEYEDPPKVTGKLTSVGSALITVLLNRWASEFVTLHPEAGLDILSGGSVDGFPKFVAGQADMVPMSRPLTDAEVMHFKKAFGYEPLQIVVAQDAVGIYVNKDNPVAGLTLGQLEGIFSRHPKSGVSPPEFWSDLGVSGPLANERLVRVSLNKSHGSYIFFREIVLHDGDYRFDVHYEPVNGSLVQAAGADPAAICFASVMFGTQRTRFVPLQAPDGSWLLPTYENTVSGRYPLVRPLRVVFNCKPDGTMNPVAREFLRFAVSQRGQRIIALAGCYPLTAQQQAAALKIIGEAPPTTATPRK